MGDFDSSDQKIKLLVFSYDCNLLLSFIIHNIQNFKNKINRMYPFSFNFAKLS